MIFMELTGIDYAVAVTVFSFFKSTRTQSSVLKKLAKQASFMTDELRERLKAVSRSISLWLKAATSFYTIRLEEA